MWTHTTENWTAALFDQYLLTTYAIQYLNAKENMNTAFINFPSLFFSIPPPPYAEFLCPTKSLSLLSFNSFTLNKITSYHVYPQIIQVLNGSPSLSLLYFFPACITVRSTDIPLTLFPSIPFILKTSLTSFLLLT